MKSILILAFAFLAGASSAQEKIKFSNDRPEAPIIVSLVQVDTTETKIITEKGLFDAKKITSTYRVIYDKTGNIEGVEFEGVTYIVDEKEVKPLAVLKHEAQILDFSIAKPNWEYFITD